MINIDVFELGGDAGAQATLFALRIYVSKICSYTLVVLCLFYVIQQSWWYIGIYCMGNALRLV